MARCESRIAWLKNWFSIGSAVPKVSRGFHPSAAADHCHVVHGALHLVGHHRFIYIRIRLTIFTIAGEKPVTQKLFSSPTSTPVQR